MTTSTTTAHYYYTSEGMFCADDFEAMFTQRDKQALTFIEPVARPNFDTDDECAYCRNRVDAMTWRELMDVIVENEVTEANGEYMFMVAAQIIRLEHKEENDARDLYAPRNTGTAQNK